GLIGPCKITPNHAKIHQTDHISHGKHRQCQHNPVFQCALPDVEDICKQQPGAAKSGVSGSDGSYHHANNGQYTADLPEQPGTNFIDGHGRISRPLIHKYIQFTDTAEVAHAYSCPDHCHHPLGYHRTVKHTSSLSFMLHTAGNKR